MTLAWQTASLNLVLLCRPNGLHYSDLFTGSEALRADVRLETYCRRGLPPCRIIVSPNDSEPVGVSSRSSI
jgi:hypothetical protein